MSMSASVWMLSSQRPLSANVANAASAQIAAFTPPNRSATRTPTIVVPIQVIQPQNRVTQETRSSRNVAKPLNVRNDGTGALGVPLVDKPRLEVVQVDRERGPHQPPGHAYSLSSAK